MARPEKTGLDYFPLDTSWETNMKLIKARFKLAGVGCIIELWRAVYREGYALRWDEDTQLLFASENGIDVEDLHKIVAFASEKGLFSIDILSARGYLTSHGIQKRWREIALASKRKDCSIRKDLCLLEFLPEETGLTPEETEFTPGESTQSKGKERRVINPLGVNYDSSFPEAESRPTVGALEAPPFGQSSRGRPEPVSARQELAAKPVQPGPALDPEVAKVKAELAKTTARDFIASAQAAKLQPRKSSAPFDPSKEDFVSADPAFSTS